MSFSEYERITILDKIRDHECKICTRAKKCDLKEIIVDHPTTACSSDVMWLAPGGSAGSWRRPNEQGILLL